MTRKEHLARLIRSTYAGFARPQGGAQVQITSDEWRTHCYRLTAGDKIRTSIVAIALISPIPRRGFDVSYARGCMSC